MPNNKSPDVILEFEPDVDSEQEFSDFIEDVLAWDDSKENNNKNVQNSPKTDN